jgi:secondary thiamine-phosphate synthase enzyme
LNQSLGFFTSIFKAKWLGPCACGIASLSGGIAQNLNICFGHIYEFSNQRFSNLFRVTIYFCRNKREFMIQQVEFSLPPYSRGFHLITREIVQQLPALPEMGLLHLFIKHTSAGLAINENADPTVLSDFEKIFNVLVREDYPFLEHTLEGPDDMPAHVKAVLSGHSVSIPISRGSLNLGTWQGIYLCEFRNRGGSRKLVATLYS